MRRLQIDEIVKQGLALKTSGDLKGYRHSIELLRNIACSITATIRAGEYSNPGKFEEIKFIVDCIKQLQDVK